MAKKYEEKKFDSFLFVIKKIPSKSEHKKSLEKKFNYIFVLTFFLYTKQM